MLRYRTAVLRALPNLKTLDDKVVTNEEVQIALTKGSILAHPWDMESSPPPSGAASPEVLSNRSLIFCRDNLGSNFRI